MPVAKTSFFCFGAGKVCLTVKNTGYQLVARLRVVAPNAAQQAVNEPADVLLGRVYPRNDLHHINRIVLIGHDAVNILRESSPLQSICVTHVSTSL